MRIGLGLDTHRLITDPGRPLRLGGVTIPGDLALEGHSDADALLHALTDAILGALGLGDIGEYFPPADAQWKDADSTLFLTHALDAMREKGYQLANIDCVIMAEVPRLSPHKSTIRKQLAELLELPSDCVGMKATTAEKLGALGRGEGLLAQVVVLLVPAVSPETSSTTRKVPTKKSAGAKLPPPPSVDPGAIKGQVLHVWCDGGSRGNPGPAAIGVVMKDTAGGVVHAAGQTIGETTNNVAEYRSLIYALQVALALDPSEVLVQMDSELVVKQMKGEYKVREEHLARLHAQAQSAAEMLRKVRYQHVRRELNAEADALANQALDAAE